MESAVVHQYHGKVEDAISADGRLALIKDDFLPERYVVAAKADGAVVKADGAADDAVSLEEAGKGEGSAGIVFCHSPINGEPCGLCGPCDDAMNTGMEWRMPPAAQKRYKRKGLHKGIRSLKRRLGVK